MATLAATIRRKIDSGALLCERPARMVGGRGDGSPCTACDMPIVPAQVELSFRSRPALTHRFHLACHGLWEAECHRRRWRNTGGQARRA